MKVHSLPFLSISLVSSLCGSERTDPPVGGLLDTDAAPHVSIETKIPPCPWTPNCVSSREKSRWGALYNVEPLKVPEEETDPVQTMKCLLEQVDEPFLKAERLELLEEGPDFLHYTYRVDIPSGPLKGIYIDDVHIYYDKEKKVLELRSASRKGFRDAVHFDFSLPGANKKRMDALRYIWQVHFSDHAL